MAFVCEICGGTSVVKNGDTFACEACGTKYSAENVKKMMSGAATTPVTPETPKIDKAQLLKDYREKGRDAVDAENWTLVSKYWGEVLQLDKDDLEACFFISYAETVKALKMREFSYRENACNDLVLFFRAFCNSVNEDNANFMSSKIMRCCTVMLKLWQCEIVYNTSYDAYGVATNDLQKTINLFNRVRVEFCKAYEAMLPRVTKSFAVAYYVSTLETVSKTTEREKPVEKLLMSLFPEYRRKIEIREKAKKKFFNRKENVVCSLFPLIFAIFSMIFTITGFTMALIHSLETSYDMEYYITGSVFAMCGFALSVPTFVFSIITLAKRSNRKMPKLAKVFAIIALVFSFLGGCLGGFVAFAAVPFLVGIIVMTSKLQKIRDWDKYWEKMEMVLLAEPAQKTAQTPAPAPAASATDEPGELSLGK